MARTTTVMFALVIAAGIVVAMLPAQESSRRRPSVYGGTPVEGEPAPAPEPGLIPVEASTLPPPTSFAPATGTAAPAGMLAEDAGSLSSQLEASGQAASQEYTPSPSAGGSIYAPAEVSPPAGAIPMPRGATISDDESPAAGQPRSVLKRVRTAPAEAEPPSAVPSRAAVQPPASRSGPSSRRIPSGISASTAARSARAPVIDTRAITETAVSGRSPALRVDVAGPQGISVGKPASYLITIVNESDTAAPETQLRLSVPAFVTIGETQPSEGEAGMQADETGAARLMWSLPGIGARGHQTLRLQLVAGEGQPFDIGVEWISRPSFAKASIVVRQPQLALSLSGPADMIYGEEKTFTLEVSNPGSGDAENVVVQLSAGQGRGQQLDVGTIPAGQAKQLSVPIVANQPGELSIHAQASGDGDLAAEAAGKVIVRKAELAVHVEGPQLKYAGSEATYAVTIQNTGNAPAENVQLALALPPAAKYLGGIDGLASASGSLKWKLSSLPPGIEKSYEVRLLHSAAGECRLALQAQAGGGIAASGEAITTVEAAADLKLVVEDPAGPLPTSEPAVYQVQIMNRGSDSARQVKIVMQFSDGIEPVAFDGCQAKIVPGQVVCHPLSELGAGEQVTIRVQARAGRGGTHQFRVEVVSDESETRLVSEGTTKFFADTTRPSAAASTAKKPAAAPPSIYQR